MLSAVRTVFIKDLRETVRDTRTLLTIIGTNLLFAVMIFVMLSFFQSTIEGDKDRRIGIVGGDYAPTLVAALQSQGLGATPYESRKALQQAVAEEGLIGLVIPENYAETYRALRPVPVELMADLSDRDTGRELRRVREAIEQVTGRIRWQRMIAAGVAPSQMQPLSLSIVDVSRSGFGALFASLILYFFFLPGLMAGAGASAEAIAGERERHSLGRLLVQPVSRSSLMLGKWANLVALAAAATLLIVIGGNVALSLSPLSEIGIRLSATFETGLLMAITLMPLAMPVAALQLLISMNAKGYREATTSLQLINIVPIFAILATTSFGLSPPLWVNALPLLNQVEVLKTLFNDAIFNWALWAVGLLGAILFSALLLFFIRRKLESDEVVG